MRGLLKASAIINFIVASISTLWALLLIPAFLWIGNNFMVVALIILLHIVFSFLTGALFLKYSKLELYELYKKKDIILILGIIFLFVNFIISILLFITHDQIKNKYQIAKKEGTLKAIKVKKKDSETKRIDILLKIGVILVGISGLIFAVTNWRIISPIIKVDILLLMSLLFLLLSIYSERKLKLKQASIMYCLLGETLFMFALISCGIFNVLGSWFSFTGQGNLIFIASLTALLTYFSICNYRKYKQPVYLGIALITTILTLSFILAYASVSFITVILILTLIITLLNTVRQKENLTIKFLNNFDLIITILLSIVLMIYFVLPNQGNILLNSITTFLLGANLLYFVSKKKHDFVNMIAPVILVILVATTIISFNLSSINSLSLAGIIYTIGYIGMIFAKNLYKNKTFEFGLTLMIDLVLLGIFGLSFFVDPHMVMFTAFLILITTLINYMFDKDYSKLEYYLNPIKVLLFTIATLYLFNTILPISVLFGQCICYLILLLGYLFTKEKKLKLEYFLLFGLLLIITLATINSNSETIPCLIVLLSSIFPVMITNKNKDELYRNMSLGAFVLMLITVYHVIINANILGPFQNLSVFLVMFIYLVIMLANRTNKEKFMATAVAIIIPFYNLATGDLCSYPVTKIIAHALAFYILFMLVDNLVKKKATKSTLYTIFTCLILLSLVFEQNLLIGLFVSLISLFIMIVGVLKDEYKALFITGLVFLILSLVVQLRNFWFQIPFWLYLMTAGLLLIGIVMYKELHKKK